MLFRSIHSKSIACGVTQSEPKTLRLVLTQVASVINSVTGLLKSHEVVSLSRLWLFTIFGTDPRLWIINNLAWTLVWGAEPGDRLGIRMIRPPPPASSKYISLTSPTVIISWDSVKFVKHEQQWVSVFRKTHLKYLFLKLILFLTKHLNTSKCTFD